MLNEPQIALWHSTRNLPATIGTYSPMSHKKVWWLGKCGHEWEGSIRDCSGNCPYCINKRVLTGYNDLASTNPELLPEWDYSKNHVSPTNILAGHTKKTYWLCSKHKHSWFIPPKSRIEGSGCPICANKQLLVGFNDLATRNPELLPEWDYEKNDFTSKEVIYSSAIQVNWKCNQGHKWKTPLYRRTSLKTGCKQCQTVNSKNPSISKTSLMKEWDYRKNSSFNPEYLTTGSSKKVWWKCVNHHSWECTPRNRSLGQDCSICSNSSLLVGTNDLATKMPEILTYWDYEKNLVSPTKIIFNSRKVFYWQDSICNHKWEANLFNVQKADTKCPFCSNRKVLQGFNDLITTHPQIVEEWDFNINTIKPHEVSSASTQKAWWIGKCGHNWEQAIIKRAIRSHGCIYCSNQKILMGHNDLATKRPDLTQNWSNKNILLPSEIINGSKQKVWLTCKLGHETNVRLDYASSQQNFCKFCLNRKLLIGFNDLATKFPELSSQWSTNNPKKPNNILFNSKEIVEWICEKGHTWEKSLVKRTAYPSCPKCLASSYSSLPEKELATFVSKLKIKIELNVRKVLPRSEIDVYAPEKRIGVEFNGLYWHSNSYKNFEYHLNKYKKSLDVNVTLLQVSEYDYYMNNTETLDRITAYFKEDVLDSSLIQFETNENSIKFYENNTIIGSAILEYAIDGTKNLSIKNIISYVNVSVLIEKMVTVFNEYNVIFEQNNDWPFPSKTLEILKLTPVNTQEPQLISYIFRGQTHKVWDSGRTFFKRK